MSFEHSSGVVSAPEGAPLPREGGTTSAAPSGDARGAHPDRARLLETVLDATPAPIFYKDAGGVYLGCNQAFSALLGLPKERILGQTVYGVNPREKADVFHAADMELLTRGDRQTYETSVRDAAGRTREFLFHKAVFRGPDGAVGGIVGTMLDITQRKRAESLILALAEGVSAATGETFFRSLVAHLGSTLDADYALIGEVDPAGQRVQTIAVRAHGQEAENFAYDLAHTPCEDVVRKNLCVYPRKVWELFPQDKMLADLGIQAYVGTPLVSSSGQVLGVMVVLYERELADPAEAESLLQIFAVRAAAEIERKRAEDAVRSQEERFRVLVEASPLGVSLIGPDGAYKYVNPKFSELFGYTLGDLASGRDWFAQAYPDPEYRRTVVATWQADLRASRPGEARPRTFTIRSKGGEERVVHFRPVTLPSGDQLVIYEDVTEQRRLQAQLVHSQKMEAVGTLASGVAHDFNNLLQAISGYAQLLGTGGLDARGREYLGQIERAADRAGELVRSLLAFSRKEKPRLRPLDLNHEVAQTVQILGRTIPKMVEIRTDLAPDLRPIQGDPTQIDQVLMNLATNARDAMPGGGVLRVETRDVELDEDHCQGQLDASPGPHVLLRVSDTGCGMDAATLRHVFEPFFTTKPLGQGTGLGLSTVYGIVRAHGGHVTCRSRPGAGTAFEVYLPAIPPANARAEEPRPQAEEARGGRETVLIVDDEAAIRELAQTLLEARGYTVLAACSGEEALTLYRQRGGGIDLVLLDLGMPGMGGRACLAELLRLDPGARVVVASGYCADDHVQGALDAGATGFLGKPYRLSELSRAVREVLDRPSAR